MATTITESGTTTVGDKTIAWARGTATVNGKTVKTFTWGDETAYAGVARIGRTGMKVHPVWLYIDEHRSNAFMKVFRLKNFSCTCGGTANGAAYHKAQIFLGDRQLVNCGNAG